MSAEQVVAASLKSLERRRVVCIPGWKNRLLVRLGKSVLGGLVLDRLQRRFKAELEI